jgi:hypothetical protein
VLDATAISPLARAAAAPAFPPPLKQSPLTDPERAGPCIPSSHLEGDWASDREQPWYSPNS